MRAARAWAALIEGSEELELHGTPELDILTFLPGAARAPSADAVDRVSAAVLDAGMADPDPVYLSTLRIDADDLLARHPRLAGGGEGPARILRSVLMKPEHEPAVPWLHERVCELTRGVV